jgi:predicted nucleic acid-binding protein
MRYVLDAGVFVAYERGDARIRARLMKALEHKIDLVTTSPVVGQVWRDGRRQALLAILLAAVEIDAPSEARARRAGELLRRSRTADVVDALLVELARDGDAILTSDAGDVERLVEAADKRCAVIAV